MEELNLERLPPSGDFCCAISIDLVRSAGSFRECRDYGMDECGVNDEFLGIGSSLAQKIIQDLHPSETYRQFL